MSSTAYVSVLTTAPQQVPAYLYMTSRIVLTLQGDPAVSDRTGLVIAVRSDLGVDNSENLADYQAQRLNSGLHTSAVYGTLPEALNRLTDSLVASRHTSQTYTGR